MVNLVDGEKQDWGIYLEAHASKEELERKGDKDYREDQQQNSLYR